MVKLFSDPFLKNQNQKYLYINSLKFYTFCFHCLPSRRSKDIETDIEASDHLLLRLLTKTKRGLELVSQPHFLYDV